MKKNNKTQDPNREKIWWFLSPDMLVYLAWPIIQIWRTVTYILQQGSANTFPLIIADAVTLILSIVLLTVIYKRNKDKHAVRSRSKIIITLFALILLSATIKDTLTILFL